MTTINNGPVTVCSHCYKYIAVFKGQPSDPLPLKRHTLCYNCRGVLEYAYISNTPQADLLLAINYQWLYENVKAFKAAISGMKIPRIHIMFRLDKPPTEGTHQPHLPSLEALLNQLV